MSAPSKPWTALSPAEKREAVLPLVEAGKTYTEIAQALAAPSRNSVSSVVFEMRKAGILPPATRTNAKTIAVKTSRKRGGILGGKPSKAMRDAYARRNDPEGRSGTARKAPSADSGGDAKASSGVKPAARTFPDVASFVAAHGVRRFERGAVTDLVYLQNYLTAKGYTAAMRKGGGLFTITGKGATRRLTRTEFFAFVDEFRIADGLEPFLPRPSANRKAA